MNSFLIMPMLFLCLTKPFLFLGYSYVLTDSTMLFLGMFFLVFFIIFSSNFSFASIEDKSVYLIGFVVVFLSLFFCFSSSSSIIFLFWLEMCVFWMIFLIFSFSKEIDKVSSTLFMFFLNILGSIPFMIFCFSFNNKLENLHWSMFLTKSCVSLSMLFFLSLILILKLPVFIGHFWLTKAHVSASGPLSMILASLMLKLGSMGLLKFSYLTSSGFTKVANWVLVGSLMSCFLFSLLMIFFFDLKFLIACSSVLHMSLLVPMTLSGSSVGSLSSLLMTIGHGFTSLILFFLLTLMYEFSMSRSSDLSKCQESQTKFYTKWMFAFVFINLGIPPFLSFMSELLIFSFLISNSKILAWMFGGVMMMSLFFTILLILKILFGKKTDSSEVLEAPLFSVFLKFCALILVFFSSLIP